MKIAIASGKGGTGKTTIATSLALSAGAGAQYLDCDVEEPNGHIFLRPTLTSSELCNVTVPSIDEKRCTACGECRDICNFNAIVQFGETVMTFPELCHSCGGCFRVCKENALLPAVREIGVVESGTASGLGFIHGRVRIGEAMSVPLLKAVKERAEQEKLLIIDAPPGTSCPFVETVADAEYVILVTEPTPFGLHDLRLAVEVVQKFEIPCGVIVNRANLGDNRVEQFCMEAAIPVLLSIPFDRKIAEGYARGVNLIETVPELKSSFVSVLDTIAAQVA